MKVSLRKANAVQLLINEKLAVATVAVATISKYDKVAEALVEAQTKLYGGIAEKFDLIGLLFSIREKVAHAGMTAGIAKLLTALARNEKETAFVKQLEISSPLKFTPSQISEIIADLATQKDSYGRTKDAVTVGLLPQSAIDDYKTTIGTLRKEKTTISDKLLHLNVSTEIELDEKEVAVLKKYDIL